MPSPRARSTSSPEAESSDSDVEVHESAESSVITTGPPRRSSRFKPATVNVKMEPIDNEIEEITEMDYDAGDT